MRRISDKFMNDLKNGLLTPIVDRVKKDDTLLLSIRDAAINIYFRGANLLRITDSNGYRSRFDDAHDLSPGKRDYAKLDLPPVISNLVEAEKWVSAFANLKEIIDLSRGKNPQPEKEFQQVVARENNRSGISGKTEYFIADIEKSESEIGARIDMAAVRWPEKGRKDYNNYRVSFIEMKYGDAALGGRSGLVKHMADMVEFLSVNGNYARMVAMIDSQFHQLMELNLIETGLSERTPDTQINAASKPEFVILIANHNPRSDKLLSILREPEFKKHADSELFDLKFVSGNGGGYALYEKYMLSYAQFVQHLEAQS